MSRITQPPRTEHERKFLVIVQKLPKKLPKPKRLVQGYLSYEPLQSRIRITGEKSALHEFKGQNDLEIPTGKISVAEAEFLLEHYGLGSRVEKSRHLFPTGKKLLFDDGKKELVWELDVFFEKNASLYLAEIELPSLKTPLPKPLPSWIGKEVTNDARFKNRNLSIRPFGTWPEMEKKVIFKLMGL